jgi:hypothetical protein
MNLLHKYNNGPYTVAIYDDGTKVRSYDGSGEPAHPESIDLKITNQCDLGCSFCHENSKPDGGHASWGTIEEILKGLPPGVEIAIGGGNPLSHPDLLNILECMKMDGLIANITVNYFHVLEGTNREFLLDLSAAGLIHGIGVSGKWIDLGDECNLPNMVWHLILGETSPFDLVLDKDTFVKNPSKILLLGDKRYGRGVNHFANDEAKLRYWRYHLPMVLSQKNLCISFDNLALEQLHAKEVIPPEIWGERFMGNEGTFTMYVDAVTMTFAKNSISDRIPIEGKSIQEMFSVIRKGVTHDQV